ncbi:hypothetical protein GCM10007100_14240 [Roseibacillus persicicus]|uniref:Uncharacterized protein n=2 Tax=Roseibacillus persicicus TaxID=454148 RepID=A0A918THH9_9BACT|nr:hypothetical protein GCM10007100_14240 [Roseibacillus persicicus]
MFDDEIRSSLVWFMKYWLRTDANPPVIGPLSLEDMSYRFKAGTIAIETLVLEDRGQSYRDLSVEDFSLPLSSLIDSEGNPRPAEQAPVEASVEFSGRYGELRKQIQSGWKAICVVLMLYTIFVFAVAGVAGPLALLWGLFTAFSGLVVAFFGKHVLLLLIDISEALQSDKE